MFQQSPPLLNSASLAPESTPIMLVNEDINVTIEQYHAIIKRNMRFYLILEISKTLISFYNEL